MDVDSAATFLACSILVSVGVAALCGVLVLLNNLFSKYWKPTSFSLIPAWYTNTTQQQYRFVDPQDVGTVTKSTTTKTTTRHEPT